MANMNSNLSSMIADLDLKELIEKAGVSAYCRARYATICRHKDIFNFNID